MSRPPRIEYPGAWYHVINRGGRGEPVFMGPPDYEAFVSLLDEASKLWDLCVFAYCFVPNYDHLLVQTLDASISRCMTHINGVYVQRFGCLHHLEEQLLRGRCK